MHLTTPLWTKTHLNTCKPLTYSQPNPRAPKICGTKNLMTLLNLTNASLWILTVLKFLKMKKVVTSYLARENFNLKIVQSPLDKDKSVKLVTSQGRGNNSKGRIPPHQGMKMRKSVSMKMRSMSFLSNLILNLSTIAKDN